MRLERRFSPHAIWLIAVAGISVLSAGCAATLPRDIVPEKFVDQAQLAGMSEIRIWGDASERSLKKLVLAEGPKMRNLVLSRTRPGQRPTFNAVAFSGGAEDGAYGAALMIGWSDRGSRPDFDLVTGVSAGALIAPLVFLGKQKDPELKTVFTETTQDNIFTANIPSGLFGGEALADSTPLARLIARYVDRKFLKDVARERLKGRILLVGTTNIDAQRPVLWDMGCIAMSDSPEALDLFRKVLLASASIPGAFPPVRIKVHADGRNYDELHVDGGVTQQVFVAPPALTMSRPGSKTSEIVRRVFIIRNGKINPEWQAVEPTTLSIAGRSISTLIKNEGLGDLYRIYATSERDGVDFNLAAIPSDFRMTSPKPFDRTYMRALYDIGYRAGRDGYPWMKAPPGILAEGREKLSNPNLTASKTNAEN